MWFTVCKKLNLLSLEPAEKLKFQDSYHVSHLQFPEHFLKKFLVDSYSHTQQYENVILSLHLHFAPSVFFIANYSVINSYLPCYFMSDCIVWGIFLFSTNQWGKHKSHSLKLCLSILLYGSFTETGYTERGTSKCPPHKYPVLACIKDLLPYRKEN